MIDPVGDVTTLIYVVVAVLISAIVFFSAISFRLYTKTQRFKEIIDTFHKHDTLSFKTKKERRWFVRKNINISLKYRVWDPTLEHEFIPAITKDISLGGVLLQLDHQEDIDTVLELQLITGNPPKFTFLRGRIVRRVEIQKNKSYLAGIEFVDILSEKQIILKELIAQNFPEEDIS